MAERRMISRKIIQSTKFLKMPHETQLLYLFLISNADDDGVVEAFYTMRMVGASEDSLKLLVAKGFVKILNEDLVTFIMDWTEHNKIRADRKTDSIYKELLLQVLPNLKLVEKTHRSDVKQRNGQPMDSPRTDTGQPMDGIGKDRIGEVSIGKCSISSKRDLPKNLNLEAYRMWLDYKGSKYKQQGKTLSANKLAKYPQDIQMQMVEQSIMNGYAGLFELKDTKPKQQTSTRTKLEEWAMKQNGSQDVIDVTEV
jgi:hypothetical protein